MDEQPAVLAERTSGEGAGPVYNGDLQFFWQHTIIAALVGGFLTILLLELASALQQPIVSAYHRIKLFVGVVYQNIGSLTSSAKNIIIGLFRQRKTQIEMETIKIRPTIRFEDIPEVIPYDPEWNHSYIMDGGWLVTIKKWKGYDGYDFQVQEIEEQEIERDELGQVTIIEGEMHVKGHMRFDRCSNVEFSHSHGPAHFCDGLGRFGAVLQHIQEFQDRIEVK